MPMSQVHAEAVPPPQIIQEPQGGKENQTFSVTGKHSLVMNLQKTVAKKGSPDVLAPGKVTAKPNAKACLITASNFDSVHF